MLAIARCPGVPPVGLDPTTHRLKGDCCYQLSYGGSAASLARQSSRNFAACPVLTPVVGMSKVQT